MLLSLYKETYLLFQGGNSMDVQFRFKSIWSPRKQSLMNSLITKRVQILLDDTIIKKLKELNFEERLPIVDCPDLLSINDKAVLQKCSDSVFALYVSSSILFTMLEPGSGQANFDEIVLLAKNAIQTQNGTKLVS